MILEDNVGRPMHAAYISEEHQRFNSIEGSLQALHFFDNQVSMFL
jgi:hypothetical protein